MLFWHKMRIFRKTSTRFIVAFSFHMHNIHRNFVSLSVNTVVVCMPTVYAFGKQPEERKNDGLDNDKRQQWLILCFVSEYNSGRSGPRVFFLSRKLLQLTRYIEPESQRNDASVITNAANYRKNVADDSTSQIHSDDFLWRGFSDSIRQPKKRMIMIEKNLYIYILVRFVVT